MTLGDFIKAEGLSLSEAAQRFGLTHAKTLQRYVRGERIPRPDQMARIVAATDGKVQPGDFYGARAAAAHPESTPAPEAA